MKGFIGYRGSKSRPVYEKVLKKYYAGENVIVEPFCGSASCSFHLATHNPEIEKFHLFDTNKYIIAILKAVQRDARPFIARFVELEKRWVASEPSDRKALFEEVRAGVRADEEQDTATINWLNSHSYTAGRPSVEHNDLQGITDWLWMNRHSFSSSDISFEHPSSLAFGDRFKTGLTSMLWMNHKSYMGSGISRKDPSVWCFGGALNGGAWNDKVINKFFHSMLYLDRNPKFDISCSTYEQSLHLARPGTLFVVDPPYRDTLGYHGEQWNDTHNERVTQFLLDVKARGSSVIFFNNDHEDFFLNRLPGWHREDLSGGKWVGNKPRLEHVFSSEHRQTQLF